MEFVGFWTTLHRGSPPQPLSVNLENGFFSEEGPCQAPASGSLKSRCRDLPAQLFFLSPALGCLLGSDFTLTFRADAHESPSLGKRVLCPPHSEYGRIHFCPFLWTGWCCCTLFSWCFRFLFCFVNFIALTRSCSPSKDNLNVIRGTGASPWASLCLAG